MALRPPVHRPFVLIKTLDQWRRCSHEQTRIDVLAGTVELAPLPGSALDEAVIGELPTLAGLVFDRHCRLYRALPEQGRVRVHRWNPPDALDPIPDDGEGCELFVSAAVGPLGEFVSEGGEVGPLAYPTGLAIDGSDNLMIWESGTGGLLIWDLGRGRVRERITLGVTGPVDLAWIGDRLVGVGPDLPGMLERGADGHLHLRSFQRELGGVPRAVAGDSAGRIWLLLDAGTSQARIVALASEREPIEVPGASDFVFRAPRDRTELLVVARGPDQSMTSLILASDGTVSVGDALAARGYDGRGIVRSPDDRIAYFGARGLRHAVAAARRYPKRGTVIGFRLDAGEFQARWGRVFIDACVPKGTELRIATVVIDEPPTETSADDPITREPPANEELSMLKGIAETPMPPASLVPAKIEGRLFERKQGREIPWTIRDDRERRHFTTWEGVVAAGPELGEAAALGRWLWVFVELRGNGRRTPSVRVVRVEQAGHTLLARLPKLFSRDPIVGEFLWRFLAMFDGNLVDLDLRTSLRHALLNPSSSPEPFLPWLAELLGLVLDERWPVAARRTAIAEASELFRSRGTVPGLRRMLEIYLGKDTVQIFEHFRVRGLGGAIVGGEGPAESSAVLGGGFRVGGAIGVTELVDVESGQSLAELGADGFSTHAHRFSVVVLATLTSEQRSVVEHILDQHRPAHTLYQLCTADAGLRVGIGLHVELSSVVGSSATWTTLQLGGSKLGGAGIVGRPQPGTSLGVAKLGKDSLVG